MRMFPLGFLLGVSAFFLFSAARADTHCSSADNTLTYFRSHYSGGAAPPADFEISRTEWKYSGKIVLRSIDCTPAENECGQCGNEAIEDKDLVAGFDPTTDVVLYESSPHDTWYSLRKYVTKVSLHRPSGKPLPGGAERYDDFVLCVSHQLYLP